MSQFDTIDLSEWLNAEIAVITPSGAVLRTNRKWNETATIGKLTRKPGGWNYFAECRAASRRGCIEAPVILAGLENVLHGELPSFAATYACPFDGIHHWYEAVVSPIEADGQRHLVLMHVDVSSLQVDALTRLPNRSMFDAQLDLALSTAQRSGGKTGIVVVDLNNLKKINDVHGHQKGDEAVRVVATELTARAGPGTLVARIGGDEFAVVLPVSADPLSARRAHARFEPPLSRAIVSGPDTIPVNASCGMAIYPDDGMNAGELFRAADRLMYAKKRGSSAA